ncbi:MAG: type III-A CRISPR-associated protein Csm2 [Candidatus Bipolaricaulaceae bacterium]
MREQVFSRKPSGKEERYVPTADELQKILSDRATSVLLVQSAERFAQSLLAQNLRMDQVRSVFDEIKKIENLWLWQDKEEEALHRLHLLKPRLAARVRRVRGAELLYELIRLCADQIQKIPEENRKEAFVRFAEYMEAVVAYHKFYGKEEEG